MSEILINGFLVVRLPQFNRDEAGRGVFSATAPCLGTLCYGGVDRMPWFDLDDDIYNGNAPFYIQEARKHIEIQNADFSGIEVCRDFELADRLLGYANRLARHNEIIVVRSEKLTQIKGSFLFEDKPITWAGYDIVSLGNWSLLEAMFSHWPNLSKWEKSLNEFGLFSSPEGLEDYVVDYEAFAQKGLLEELPENPDGIDIIRVGKLNL